jgi:hypothetical protein
MILLWQAEGAFGEAERCRRWIDQHCMFKEAVLPVVLMQLENHDSSQVCCTPKIKAMKNSLRIQSWDTRFTSW